MGIVQKGVFGTRADGAALRRRGRSSLARRRDSQYCLATIVWSATRASLEVARGIDAGTVWIESWAIRTISSRPADLRQPVSAGGEATPLSKPPNKQTLDATPGEA